jgi:hypothetical protein
MLSVDYIWNMYPTHIMDSLNKLGPEKPNDHYLSALLLIQKYKEIGKLSDSHLLNMSRSAEVLLTHGPTGLKEVYEVRQDLTAIFNESGLVDLLSDYYYQPNYLYVSCPWCVRIVDLQTQQVIRTIALYKHRDIYILGVCGVILYLMVGKSRLLKIDISTPKHTIVSDEMLLVEGGAYLYQNFLCIYRDSWVITNVDYPNTPSRFCTFSRPLGKYLGKKSQHYNIMTGETVVLSCGRAHASIDCGTHDVFLKHNDDTLTLEDTRGKVENCLDNDYFNMEGNNVAFLDGKILLVSNIYSVRDTPWRIFSYDSDTLNFIEVEYQGDQKKITGMVVDNVNHQLVFKQGSTLTFMKLGHVGFASLSNIVVTENFCIG